MFRRSEEEDADAFPWLTFWLKFTLEIDSAHATKNGVGKLPSSKAWRVLVYLATQPDGATSVGDVRRACELSQATATRILNALADAGYVAGGTASDDGRVKELRLTKDGRIAIGKIFHAARRSL